MKIYKYIIPLFFLLSLSCGDNSLNDSDRAGSLRISCSFSDKGAAKISGATVSAEISIRDIANNLITAKTLEMTGKTASGTVKVKAGSGYTVNVTGYDNLNKPTYTGSTSNVTVTAGKTTNVAITLVKITQDTFTISGTVSGADSVSVVLSGDKTETQTVNNGGSYSFTVSAAGNFTVTPSKAGWKFTPESKIINNINSNISQNFTATQQTYTISGTVSGADGVKVTLSGGKSESQTINNGGTYSFTVTTGGNYTVTPSKTGWNFNPESKSFNAVSSNQTQNFTGQFPGRILFTSNRDGNQEIYIMDIDGSNQRNLSNNPADDWTPNCSPDGKKIVFASTRNGYRDIYIMNIDGSDQKKLTNNRNTALWPRFSPDGSKIIFQDGQIYIINIDGSNEVKITNAGENALPSWSPDMQKICFTSFRDGNHWQLYIMDIDGSDIQQLTTEPIEHWTSTWSPDGSKIVFLAGVADIYVINSDGSNQVKLTQTNAYEWDPAWSSDGSKILFTSERDGNREIYIMNPDGSNQINLTNNNARDEYPAWVPF